MALLEMSQQSPVDWRHSSHSVSLVRSLNCRAAVRGVWTSTQRRVCVPTNLKRHMLLTVNSWLLCPFNGLIEVVVFSCSDDLVRSMCLNGVTLGCTNTHCCYCMRYCTFSVVSVIRAFIPPNLCHFRRSHFAICSHLCMFCCSSIQLISHYKHSTAH